MYGSTCFGHPHAHHQELSNCSSSLWFYRWSVVVAVLFVVGPNHDQQHCYHHSPTVKPEAATAVELLMMGVRTPETCWAVHKRQVINLRSCCIWLVDLFEIQYKIWSNSFQVFHSYTTWHKNHVCSTISKPLRLRKKWSRHEICVSLLFRNFVWNIFCSAK